MESFGKILNLVLSLLGIHDLYNYLFNFLWLFYKEWGYQLKHSVGYDWDIKGSQSYDNQPDMQAQMCRSYENNVCHK